MFCWRKETIRPLSATLNNDVYSRVKRSFCKRAAQVNLSDNDMTQHASDSAVDNDSRLLLKDGIWISYLNVF